MKIVDYYNVYDLKEVINASGKMSILGVSTYADSVIDAQKFGGQHFFEMEDLIKKTGHYIAKLVHAEDSTIELGGGKVIEAGYANMCTDQHIESIITEETAAILYVKSHHTVQKSMLSIKEALQVARTHNLPLILDAAAEEDLFSYVSLGVDLVIYSGAKAFEGTSSGLVLGRADLIEWVRLQ